MIPYAIAAAAWAATVAVASWWFYGAGRDAEIATQAREDRAAREATDAALKVTAEAIGRIKVQHRTVQQEVQREVVERAVYRDCKHSDDGMRNINAALTGRAEPTGSGLVPRVDAADGLKLRGDDAEAGGSGGAVPGM